jgi:hypothetical protein
VVRTEGLKPSLSDTSRVTGDSQARFCEGLGVKFSGPTRPGSNCVSLKGEVIGGAAPDRVRLPHPVSRIMTTMSDNKIGRIVLRSRLPSVRK